MTPSVCFGWAILLGVYGSVLSCLHSYPAAGVYAALSGIVVVIGAARETRDREIERTAPIAIIHRDR